MASGTNASSDLQINDYVTVTRDGSTVEAVLLYRGPVGDDDTNTIWLGLRLTGTFAGTGEHNGTVDGRAYFVCPDRCGILVRQSADDDVVVQKRTLTRLEELRLTRELAKSKISSGGGGSSSGGAPASSGSGIPGPRTPVRSDAATSTTAASDGTPVSTARSSLEEIRQRRKALAAKKQQVQATAAAASSPTVAASSTTTTPPRTSASSRSTSSSPVPSSQTASQQQQQQQNELKEALQAKTEQADALTQQLNQFQEASKKHAAQVAALETSLREAQTAAANATVAAVETPTKARLTQSIEDATAHTHDLQSQLDQRTEDLTDATARAEAAERRSHEADTARTAALDDLVQARAAAAALQAQYTTITQASDQRGTSDAVHYKERAKLQADVQAAVRARTALEQEKLDLEATLEDLTLDKEQLQEEKEAADERYEEMKLDAETAQMEVEELRMELEDARATADRMSGVEDTLVTAAVAAGGGGTAATASSPGAEQEEMMQALRVQNGRLREALIRLREQSSLEKMEMSRELRTVEKDATANQAIKDKMEELKGLTMIQEEQINDLKDMVEQGAAFESMVEDLSDRVLSIEEENITLQGMVREMEEAAEVTAEMEEVQADEIKALSFDLEGRDTIIRNLEEAIKMQRRREDDFRRTVGNYKSTVDTLKVEKSALLELQQGGEGEKSSLIASSQKALSKAAQLVADAARVRIREAQAVVDHVEKVAVEHMVARLERLLPHNSVSNEVSAMKGELQASTLIGKAALSLEGIRTAFGQVIRPPLPQTPGESAEVTKIDGALVLPDEVQQQIATMLHQTDFAHLISNISSDLLRFLAAGQWPDVLSPQSSAELGSILGHALPELDQQMSLVLKTLKEEGQLTVEQSNVGELRLVMQNTFLALRAELEREDTTILSPNWNPPGRQLLKDSSECKFSSLGAAAALSLAVDTQTDVHSSLTVLYNKVEQVSSQAVNANLRLASLDLSDEKTVDMFAALYTELRLEASTMFQTIRELLMDGREIGPSETASDKALQVLVKINSLLRSEQLNPNDDEQCHLLSPEVKDAWGGITTTARAIRSIDGDHEDVNYLLRARAIEHRIFDAVENEPKLEIANTRVTSLEKTLGSRSKEIAMQNVRLSELEKAVARTAPSPRGRSSAGGKPMDLSSSEEFTTLKEENRVLTEAMEVMQREVETYENEIRSLKDFKSPTKRGASQRTPSRRNLSPNPARLNFMDAGNNAGGGGGGIGGGVQNTSALEATLFRPALREALEEAAQWKSSATAAAMLSLPPLPMPSPLATANSAAGSVSDDLARLSSAIAANRIQKASIRLVDLTNNAAKTPRAQLRELKANRKANRDRLESIMLQCRGRNPQ